MTRLVVDASVAVKWFMPEELAAEADQLLDSRYALTAPDLLWLEVGSAFWKKVRRGDVDADSARGILRDLARFPIHVAPSFPLSSPALDIALRHGVTIYDGLYIALALAERSEFITADRRLRDRCRDQGIGATVSWLGDPR